MTTLFWEAGSPFGLTSLKLLLSVAGLGLLCIVWILYRGWRTDLRPAKSGAQGGRHERVRQESRGWTHKLGAIALNLVLYAGAVALPAIGLLLLVNRGENFYVSFAELAAQISQFG